MMTASHRIPNTKCQSIFGALSIRDQIIKLVGHGAELETVAATTGAGVVVAVADPAPAPGVKNAQEKAQTKFLESVLHGQDKDNQDPKKLPQTHTRTSSISSIEPTVGAASAIAVPTGTTIPSQEPDNESGNSSSGIIGHNTHEKKQQQQQQQHGGPQHERKVSWGGKTIVIPQTTDNNDDPMPTVLSERIFDHYSGDHDGHVSPEGGDKKTEIAMAASELVSAIEAKMTHENLENVDSFEAPTRLNNTRRHGHQREDSSTAAAITVDDLAKLHPIESEATLEIIKAIELKDQEYQENHHDGEEQSEAIANAFKSTDNKLLENVPEGAESIFSSTKMPHGSTVVSTNTPMSETIKSSVSNTHRDLSPQRNRGRIYSNASSLELRTSGSGPQTFARHGRTDTTVTDPTISSTARSPTRNPHRQQPYEQRRKHHRRKETMEERLFFLNQALDATNGTGPDERSASNRLNQDRMKEEEDDERFMHHRATTSLDLFNQNLARLFQGVDINPTEQETVPLTQHIGGTNSRLPRVNDDSESTSSTTDIKQEDKQELEVLSGEGILSSEAKPKRIHEREISSGSAKLAQKESLVDETMEQKDQFGNPDIDMESGRLRTSVVSPNHTEKKRRSGFSRLLSKIGLIQDIEFFLKPRSPTFLSYLKNLCWLILLATVTAATFFYVGSNPPLDYISDVELSKNTTCSYFPNPKNKANDDDGDGLKASYSWWILFMLVRLPITLTIAWSLEIFVIEFIILECRWVGSCMGPTFTLLIVQANGWPAVLFFWSLCNIAMLYGTSRFANHWGYWQDYIELFNECNSSGNIIAHSMNIKLQLIALALSVIVSVKRLLIGFRQGRKTFLHYAEELSKLMKKILLISEVSNLAIQLEIEDENNDDLSDPDSDSSYAEEDFKQGRHSIFKQGRQSNISVRRAKIAGIDTAAQMIQEDIDKEEGVHHPEDDEVQLESSIASKTYATSKSNTTRNKLVISDRDKELVTGLLSQSQKRRIERLLGNWEEPEREKILTDSVSIGAILQFRKSLSKLDSKYPFGFSFGRAGMRDHCVRSAQSLYLRLLGTSDQTLHFNVLGLLAVQPDGSLNEDKLKSLIKVFRPDRDGRLSLIDFVKSVDAVYKEMKLLRASVRSSQKIDKSFEQIFNIVFYFVLGLLILNALGYNALVVFGSLSSVILSFSFMISQASAKFVEGLLFILCRRPYDIGDNITIQGVNSESSMNGSTFWVVRDIDLLTTTVLFAFTGEVATLSNGSIANSRVMNGARSLPAVLYVTLRFGVDTSFDKLEIFREAVSQYVHKRPREWVKLNDIKNCDVSTEKGYVEYLVVLQHVNNWQELGSLFTSRSHARTFCHELSKQLDIRYKSPSLPVDLNVPGGGLAAQLRESLQAEAAAAAPGVGDAGVQSAAVATAPRHPFSTDSDQIRDLTARLASDSDMIRSLISDRRL
eukprot:jgi/Psemu1/325666/estExt_fgenesh1_pg.C_2640022